MSLISLQRCLLRTRECTRVFENSSLVPSNVRYLHQMRMQLRKELWVNILYTDAQTILMCFKKQKPGLTMRTWDSDGTACTMFEGHFVFLTDNPSKAGFDMALEMVPWGTVCKNRLEPRPRVLQTAVTLNKLSLAALYHTEHNFGPSSVWNPQQCICCWLRERVTILFLKQHQMWNIKKGIQVFTWHKAATDSCTRGPGHPRSPAPQPSRIIWRRWAAWPPSGSPWLLCSAVSWPGRPPAAQPCPGLHQRSCWLWLPLAGPVRPPPLGSVTHVIKIKVGMWLLLHIPPGLLLFFTQMWPLYTQLLPCQQQQCWSAWFPSDCPIHPGCTLPPSGRAGKTSNSFTVNFQSKRWISIHYFLTHSAPFTQSNSK